MRLVTHFTFVLGSLAATTPPIQYAQISIEVIQTDVYKDADVAHPSEELGMEYLQSNSILSARYANGDPASLHFRFENLDDRDGLTRGELGFPIMFAFRAAGGDFYTLNGKRALGSHMARIWPGWASLRPGR